MRKRNIPSKKDMKKMKKILKKPSRLCVCALSVLLLITALLAVYNIIIPDRVSYYAGGAAPSFLGARIEADRASLETFGDSSETTYTAEYKLLGVPIKEVSVSVFKRTRLAVGGMPFGVKFATDGVLVVGFAESKNVSKNPAYIAGIRIGDTIKKVNEREISSAHELTDAVERSGGNPISLVCERDGKELCFNLTPYFSKDEGKYKTGIFVRDSGAGIGTVTYIVPQTGEFAGLGHGICDGDTGSLIPIKRGIVSDVIVNGIVKGASGAPGEIKGYFKSGKTGSLIENTDCGVYGIFSPAPNCSETLEIGLRDEIHDGEAYILCTLDEGGTIGRYSISIASINRSADAGKCFTVKITDPALIEKTGGIVQGMSGSPIIQDGKLVGALTHVLINDPTMGYGIFIENMLNAAQMSMARAS